jgi:hypothetical protein
MTLREEARQIFVDLFGPEIAKEVDEFDKPEDYPRDFLDECTFFMGKLIGEGSARKKFEPLYKKYAPGEGSGTARKPPGDKGGGKA